MNDKQWDEGGKCDPYPEHPFRRNNMNNNCDKDDFCTCNTCEEFYPEPDYNDPALRAEAIKSLPTAEEFFSDEETDPTVETDLTLLVQEAQLELYRTQRILAEEQLTLTRTGKEFLENQTAMMNEVMVVFREMAKKANG